MRKSYISALAMILCIGVIQFSGISGNTLSAETLVIENTAQFYSDNKPKKGLSKSQVSKRFGEPVQKYAAVGNPPISRWRYDSFTVYFEHNHVIHAVDNRKTRRLK